MGSHQSRHYEADGAKGRSYHQKHKQPKQATLQSISTTPTRSIINLSTTEFGRAEDLRSPQSHKAPPPSPLARLSNWRSNSSAVSLQSKETTGSTYSLSTCGRFFRPSSNRSASPSGHSPARQEPSSSSRPGTACSEPAIKTTDMAPPGARAPVTPIQRPKSAGHDLFNSGEEVPQINVQAPEITPAKARGRLPQAVDAVVSRFSRSRNTSPARHGTTKPPQERWMVMDAAPISHHRSETPSHPNHAPPPIFVSPPSPVSYNLPNKARRVPSATKTQAPVMGQVPSLEPAGHDTAAKSASQLFGPPTLNHRRSFFKKLEYSLRHKNGSSASSVRSTASANSLLTFNAPSVSSYTTEHDGEAPVPPVKRSVSSPQLKPGISLSELRDGLLNRGERSAKLNAMDLTRRLAGRSAPRGSGGYSDVWQAKLGSRLVAVKALRSTHTDRADDIRMRKRLGREIHVWAALRHPHILELLGFAFVDNGRPCLISPWCEYGTLQDYLKVYPSPDRRTLVRQIAEGLSYLHTRSPAVVHGDFKTMNVLVTKEHVAKICDFGGSKHLGEEKTGLTTAGLPFGTVRYSAPEISRDDSPQTLQSDVYSFGYVALETMTNKYPFWKVKNDSAVIHKVGWEGQTPSKEDYSELEDEVLWTLLRRCWSYEPSARPTMIEVCRKLAAAGYGPSRAFYFTE